MGNAFPNSLQQVVSSRIISPIQRLFKSKNVCGTMAFKHQALQAEQRSAVVAPMVEAFFERSQHREATTAAALVKILRENSALM